MSGSADYAALTAFLADPARPAGTLRYHELQGFFFTIACCPDLVSPSEWMPVVFTDRDAGYQSLEEANEILAGLMHLYNEVVRLARSELARLPGDCVIRDDALANLADDAPVAQWSRGFLHGHQ
jgi:yecA family protein